MYMENLGGVMVVQPVGGVRISPLLLCGFASLLSGFLSVVLLMNCRLASESWALGSPQPLDWRLDQGPGLGV
jgi:hypothetical protein